MTKLPILAGVFMISTILSPVGAINVNIPGADSKIPKDAYINYKTTNPDIEKDVANYVETLKATDKTEGINKSEMEYAKAAARSIQRFRRERRILRGRLMTVSMTCCRRCDPM